MRRVYPPAAYKRVARLVEDHIKAGLYRAGEKLPTIVELAELHDVTPSTSLAALKLLCDEKVIVARRGVGYFVKH